MVNTSVVSILREREKKLFIHKHEVYYMNFDLKKPLRHLYLNWRMANEPTRPDPNIKILLSTVKVTKVSKIEWRHRKKKKNSEKMNNYCGR